MAFLVTFKLLLSLQENIDFVKTSLSLSKINITGRVEFVLNAISDQYETLYPVMEVEGNGGSSKAVRESVGSEWSAVRSVTLQDILSVFPAPTYIVKTDLQGYDCQVLSDEALYTGQHFIPFIFMEFDSNSPRCSRAVDVLMSHGYSAFITIEARSGKYFYFLFLPHSQVKRKVSNLTLKLTRAASLR